MGKTIYIAATEAHSGKSVMAIGLMHTLLGSAQKVPFFKPISSQSRKFRYEQVFSCS